jgi:hypothetical protein
MKSLRYSKLDLLQKRIIAYQKRHKKIARKDVIIKKLMDDLNNRYSLIRDDYVFFDWSGKKIKGLTRDCSRASFEREFLSLNKSYDRFSNKLREKDLSKNGIENTKLYNFDILNETLYRWNQICVDRARMTDDRKNLAKVEYTLLSDYYLLIEDERFADNATRDKSFDTYIKQHNKMIDWFEESISKEEDLQKELESLLELREKIYQIEKEL